LDSGARPGGAGGPVSEADRTPEATGAGDLERALGQLRAVLETVHPRDWGRGGERLLLVDGENRIKFVTPELAEAFGLPREALLGLPLSELLRRLRTGSNAERSHELAEKTRELDETRARLTRAQHLKALGELSAEVAHEFGNLLQAIGLQAAALRRDLTLPESVARALWSIKQAVDIGRTLTRRLLTFARHDPGERREPLDVARLLRDLVQLLEPRINREGRGVRVELSLPVLPPALGNQSLLTEAFLNLFLNALDAMPEGGTLEVSATERGGEIRVTVRDSGTGMTRSELDRALDPFYTTKPGGTGLGLSTASGIVRAHGGALYLESAAGQGTTAFVCLPTVALPPAA
jgi:signal transduction histidine kinase